MTDTSPASTITADVARIRAVVTREFRDHNGDVAGEQTSRELADLIYANKPDTDAQIMRALACRLAGPARNEDPGTTMVDIVATLKALTVTVAALVSHELDDEDGREALATYVTTIDQLRYAADGVAEMGGWF